MFVWGFFGGLIRRDVDKLSGKREWVMLYRLLFDQNHNDNNAQSDYKKLSGTVEYDEACIRAGSKGTKIIGKDGRPVMPSRRVISEGRDAAHTIRTHRWRPWHINELMKQDWIG